MICSVCQKDRSAVYVKVGARSRSWAVPRCNILRLVARRTFSQCLRLLISIGGLSSLHFRTRAPVRWAIRDNDTIRHSTSLDGKRGRWQRAPVVSPSVA
jgi:hypothetical protein